MSSPRATVIVSVPHGGAAGNVLRTGLVSRLLEAHDGAEIVLVSPLVRDAAFEREFKHPRVRFEDLPPHVPAGLEGRLMALVQAAYIDSGVRKRSRRKRSAGFAPSVCWPARWRRRSSARSRGTSWSIARSRIRGPTRSSIAIVRCCW